KSSSKCESTVRCPTSTPRCSATSVRISVNKRALPSAPADMSGNAVMTASSALNSQLYCQFSQLRSRCSLVESASQLDRRLFAFLELPQNLPNIGSGQNGI